MAAPRHILFVDYLSQPSRALCLFARINALPLDEQQVLIHKRQQRSPEFLARNPLGKVPVLVCSAAAGGDGSDPTCGETFALPETCAIMSYLADVYQVPEHWLPRTDRRARARVEAVMHWQHTTIRAGCTRLVFNKVLAARLGATPNAAVAQEGETILCQALVQLEEVWLQGGKRSFVCGTQPCVVDLLLCCELEQLVLLNRAQHGVDLAQLLSPHLVVRDWMAAVAHSTAPHYAALHERLWQLGSASGGCVSPAAVTSKPAARL